MSLPIDHQALSSCSEKNQLNSNFQGKSKLALSTCDLVKSYQLYIKIERDLYNTSWICLWVVVRGEGGVGARGWR